ncbi:hypothetical protein SAMN05216244_1738 [Sediminibacillus halophilus]|uniref:Coat F domain-containing protein n=2 Tax=Sediminibacillus halophilus TaxID=482461 RepID=A0A1G9QZC1_9BACI|nr:hypothetical protein SAMN05216244_1738 [Sediminibacillus halophilus]
MNQQPMQHPPNMISSKDLLYLTDMLSWNLNASKKANFYASQCQMPEIQQALQTTAQMHQRHYQQILNHLNTQPGTLN